MSGLTDQVMLYEESLLFSDAVVNVLTRGIAHQEVL